MEVAPLEANTDIAALWTAPTWADDRSVDETIVHYTHRLGRLKADDGFEADVELIESVTLHLDATPLEVTTTGPQLRLNGQRWKLTDATEISRMITEALDLLVKSGTVPQQAMVENGPTASPLVTLA